MFELIQMKNHSFAMCVVKDLHERIVLQVITADFTQKNKTFGSKMHSEVFSANISSLTKHVYTHTNEKSFI